jgi:ABC-type spermidine/putrescine transport system permease subunit I
VPRAPRDRGVLLAVPAALTLVALYVVPMALVVRESFGRYVPGRATAGEGWTVQNYTVLAESAYLGYFLDTFRIGAVGATLGLVLGYPIAYFVARRPPGPVRKAWIAGLVATLFMSLMVRVYAFTIAFSSVGILAPAIRAAGIDPTSFRYTEAVVVAGLLHVIVPLVALTLVGSIQNVNSRLEDAAQSLGASRWEAFWTVTIPLSRRGIASAFLLAYTLCISAFVIPLVLGRGVVLLVSNLVYSRYSEMTNYPGGSAIAVVMLGLSLVSIVLVTRLGQGRVSPR